MSLAMIDSGPSDRRDAGAVLLLVLAVTVVLSLVVLALANFVAADLRFSQVVDARAKTLSSAESGIAYAVDRLRFNQTLCATNVADATVDLNAQSPTSGPVVGTALPDLLNGTDTRITCRRLDTATSPVAGWAVVLNDFGSAQSDQFRVNTNAAAKIDGPMFVPYPSAISTAFDPHFGIVDGDMWYTEAGGCTSPMVISDLAVGPDPFTPESTHGPVCTTRRSTELFSLSTPTEIPPEPTSYGAAGFADIGGCRIFSPGVYSDVSNLPLTSNVYFKSGDYRMAFGDDQFVIADSVVWVGRPDDPISDPPLIANDPCLDARDNDTGNGEGATFYFDGKSRLRVEHNGRLEMFPREHGNFMVSIQALTTSTLTTGADPPLVRTTPAFGTPVDLVVRGLVWAPNGRLALDNGINGSKHMLLGGLVVGRLWIDNIHPPGFEILPAASVVKTRVLFSSTSTTSDGVSTTIEAVVEYRPDAADLDPLDPLDDRVAIKSFRVVD